MEFEISRLDHHGVVPGVIKDLGLIDQIDRLFSILLVKTFAFRRNRFSLLLNRVMIALFTSWFQPQRICLRVR